MKHTRLKANLDNNKKNLVNLDDFVDDSFPIYILKRPLTLLKCRLESLHIHHASISLEPPISFLVIKFKFLQVIWAMPSLLVICSNQLCRRGVQGSWNL